jgi:hypothetical protein
MRFVELLMTNFGGGDIVYVNRLLEITELLGIEDEDILNQVTTFGFIEVAFEDINVWIQAIMTTITLKIEDGAVSLLNKYNEQLDSGDEELEENINDILDYIDPPAKYTIEQMIEIVEAEMTTDFYLNGCASRFRNILDDVLNDFIKEYEEDKEKAYQTLIHKIIKKHRNK